MYYVLCEDVYLVEGNAKSCLYDLKNGRLYSINQVLADKIKLINDGEIEEKNVKPELKEVLDTFIDRELIELSSTPKSHWIDEIKDKDHGCQFAWVEITSKCNLKCTHCYNESDVRCDSVMTLEDYQKVIDLLTDMNVPKIQIIGGEPFFDKEMLKNMLDYVIGKFEYIEIFTNGTLITEPWFEYLSENNIHIALSVYSYNADMHDKVTGVKGSLLRTNKTIARLKEHGIPYRVCNVLMKDIAIGEKKHDLYTLSDDKDIVRMSGRANFSLLTDELIRKKLITKKTFQIPVRKAFCKRLISGHNCFRDKMYISANLEVFPCVMERRMKHCVINNTDKIELDDKIRYLTKDSIEECKMCEYRYACFDCRPNALTNNIYEKPWYCTYHPKLGEWENEEEFILNLKELVANLSN